MANTLTAEEKQALKQLIQWIEGLEVAGHVEGQNGYFETASKCWVVFGAVALLHGIGVTELVQQVRAVA